MEIGDDASNDSFTVQDPLGDGHVEVLRASNLYGEGNPPRRGKIRDVYDLGGEMLILTTDRISAFDVVYPTLIPHKGRSLHALSVHWLSRTGGIFPNHLLESVSDRSIRVLKADRIDLEWVCRAYLYGSAWRAYRDGVRVVSGVELPGGLVMAERARRMGYTGDGLPPAIPAPVVWEVSKRCVASYAVMSGNKTLADFDMKSVDEVAEELMG